jgi:hypothetical protein
VSGIYAQIMRKTPKVKKTKCVANGDPYCEWHMPPEVTTKTLLITGLTVLKLY